MSEKPPVVGLRCNNVADIATALRATKSASFDYIVSDKIFTDRYAMCKLKGIDYPVDQPYSWFDMSLKAAEWQLNVVGVLRNLEIELEGDDPIIAERAKSLLQKEIEFTQHIGLPAVVLDLTMSNCLNLARIINSYLSTPGHNSFWLKVSMAMENESNQQGDSLLNTERRESPWNIWNQFRSHCNFESRLVAVLEIPMNLPDDNEISRWLGEPVKCIFVSTQCFTTNSSGFPVLSKKHQEVIKKFMHMGAQVVINCDSLQDSTPNGHITYRQYIDHLWACSVNGNADEDELKMRQFTAGYEDYLQSPLQPLQDNLESHTYEVFEKDPIKYELYKQAVCQALMDLIPEDEKETKTVVLMVVGAGRGPLVRSSLSAAAMAKRKIRVYAVEKNANALNTLLHLKNTEWLNDNVTVVCCDMREWVAPELADVIVSELLGSFGDNELSPECLDGAQKFLKPHGVMIPQSYTSFIAPIMSSKLYNEARRFRDGQKNPYSHFETPYVVNMKNRYEMAKPEEVFTFVHPRLDDLQTNDRYKTLTFDVSQDAVLHGFSGYFESQLYGSTLMSILPETFSDGMFSWFPIYFPLRDPIPVRQGEKVTSHFWRCSNKNSVWYEWSVSSPLAVPIHNPCGRSYTIGL